MTTFEGIKDKTLVKQCRACGYEAILLGDYWTGLAKSCGGDVARMEAELRCSKCNGACHIDAREPKPPKVYTEGDYEIMGIIGDFRRAGRKRKLRREG